jgi:NAD(P)-dependent dehydrogenase (short-subunit alcohol dehydrogenase family)
MKTVLVTGSNRGIGLEFVRKLAAREYRVLATCRDPDSAPELNTLCASHSNLELFPLELSDQASMEALAHNLRGQPIDMLINNAGIYGDKDASFGNVGGEQWMQVLQVNTIAPLLLTQLLIDNFRQGVDRKLLYISSKVGSIADNQSGSSYQYRSSKSALNQVVKSLSVDLAQENFIVVSLHPGWVLTDMGGPNALIDVETSVNGMLGVIDNLSSNESGGFFNYDGSVIPW